MDSPLLAKLDGRPPVHAHQANTTPETLRNIFRAVAPRYDLVNHLLSFGWDIAWRRKAARALPPQALRAESLVLDVCCGTGDLTLALARLSQGTVIGTDFCRPMLKRAQGKSRNLARRPPLVEADALVLPFRDDSFDAVAVAFGFRNLGDYAAGLREIRRVLKPGGRVIILEFSRVRGPFFARVFPLYFERLLPRLGNWISGVPGAYEYLVESVTRFHDQESLAAAMREAGFVGVWFANLNGGIVTLHLGAKASATSTPLTDQRSNEETADINLPPSPS